MQNPLPMETYMQWLAKQLDWRVDTLWSTLADSFSHSRAPAQETRGSVAVPPFIYSGTSHKGPSDERTLYVRPLYKGHCSRSQKLPSPIVSIHWQPPTRGQPLYKGQNSWIYIAPKVSFIRRFHCTLGNSYLKAVLTKSTSQKLYEHQVYLRS